MDPTFCARKAILITAKSPVLSAQFWKEEGVDAGGVLREWYLVLSRAIFNPDYVLFRSAVGNPAVFQVGFTSVE